MATACAHSGLADLGPDDFRAGLDAFVHGLNAQAEIADERWNALHEEILRLLLNRLRMARDLREHPEIADERIVAPVVIVSLPRTGSTKLHRMLAASGSFRTLAMWQCREFARLPGAPDGGRAERIGRTRAYEQWRNAIVPELLAAHPTFTDEADEDQLLQDASFCQSNLAAAFNVPAYGAWFAQQDMGPTYDYFLLQLKYLQWQTGGGSARPWLIKSPTHLGNEAQLARIFPGLRLIVTHRDPATCIPSLVNPARSMRRLYSHHDSSGAMGPMLTFMLGENMRRHMQWRDGNPQLPVLDIAYGDIERHDADTARAVFRYLALPLDAHADAAMQRWSVENRKDRHGSNRYAATEGSLSPDAVRTAFADYHARFRDYLG